MSRMGFPQISLFNLRKLTVVVVAVMALVGGIVITAARRSSSSTATCVAYGDPTNTFHLNGVSGVPNTINNLTPVFTLAADGAQASYSVTVDGQALPGTYRNATASTVCITSPLLSDGAHTIAAAELAPNPGPVAPYTFLVDTVAPPAPTITSARYVSPYVRVYGTGIASLHISVREAGATGTAGATVNSSGTWVAAYNRSAGMHQLYAVQVDKAGNESSPSSIVTVNVPGATTTSSAAPTTVPPSTTSTTISPLAYDLDCHGGSHGSIGLKDMAGVRIVNCKFDVNANIGLVNVTNAIIDGNTFTADTARQYSVQISDSYGVNNRITNNQLNGAALPVNGQWRGYDDGIVLFQVQGDLVDGNLLQQYWDCGIQTMELTKDTTISHNTIVNARACGIGGWIQMSWQNNTVEFNNITGSQLMFRFFNTLGLPPGATQLYFTDNKFAYNIGAQMISATQSAIFQTFDPYVVSNNRITGNDFAHLEMRGPQFFPSTGYADGGGNMCGGTSQYPVAIPCPAP